MKRFAAYTVSTAIVLAVLFLANTLLRPITFSPTVDLDPGLPSITLGGYTFHSETKGNADNPVVIALHGGPGGELMDRAILLAPYLGHDVPTTRANAGGWAHPLLRSYIGLEILNGFGITVLNSQDTVQFNMPDTVRTKAAGPMTTNYSYRLNTSYHPRADLGADVSHLPETLLIAGSEDEAFVADQYQPVMEPFTSLGTYQVLPDLQHMEVVDAPRTADLIGEWLGQ